MSFVAFLMAAAASGAAPSATETPNLYQGPPPGCRDIYRQVVERQKRQGVQRLGELPPAAAIYAVDRRVAGCPVPTPVGYRQDYLLPGAADAPEFRPAGGRSRKR